MGIESIARQILPREIEQEILDKNIKDGRGPECHMIIEWNRQTRKIFDRGRKPRASKRYVFKCIRFDGKRGYFVLEQM